MKKRKNRSALKERQQALLKSKKAHERNARYEFGPADQMPTGQKRETRQDAISFLKNTGQISPTQEQAALEFIEVFYFKCAGSLAKSQSYERQDRGGDVTHAEWLVDACKRYDAFANWSKENRATTKQNWHEVLLDVCVDGLNLTQIDRGRKWRNGTAKRVILDSLTQYAVLAGWIRRAA